MLFITKACTKQPPLMATLDFLVAIQAQEEWLYEQELHGQSPVLEAPPRFDWRKRAPSREMNKHRRLKYVRRIRIEDSEEAVRDGQFREEIRVYEKQFLPLIQAEQEVEEAVVTDRLATWGVEKLKKEGYCLTGVYAYWLDKRTIGRSVACFNLGAGIPLPHNKFLEGTQILVSRVDPLKEDDVLKGSVASSAPDGIHISFEDFEGSVHNDIVQGLWRLDLGHSNAVFERMREAIARLQCNPGYIERYPDNIPGKTEIILRGTHLRDVLLKSFASKKNSALDQQHACRLRPGAFSEDMRIQSWTQRYRRPNPVVVEGDPVLAGLNATQVRAMAMMVGEQTSLVQGPPGTGKTKTIVETVKLLKGHFEVPHPLLVCTYTNVAVNNLLEGFVAGGLKPLRIGFEGSKTGLLGPYMLEHQFDKHVMKPEYDRICKERHDVESEIRLLKKSIFEAKKKLDSGRLNKAMLGRIENMEKHDEELEIERRSWSKAKYVIEQKILRDIVRKADVICTTCIRSASHMLDVTDFPVVFLDEASMSTEPASLVPIMKGCRHLALIGDHKQLPPIVVSPRAQAGKLDKSLFERLTEEGNVPTIMLDTQYRMHPSISRFPSLEFYDLMLLDGTVSAGQIAPSLLPPSSTHLIANPETGHRPSMIFIDHQGPEAEKNRSRVNWTEAYIVCNIIEDLLRKNKDLRGEDIGVIAPYKSQINLLTRLLMKDEDVCKHFKERLNKRAIEIANIEVKTVDGFQGREKDAIVFSTVRNNQSGHIGFLADRRRLNVGLTRAKRALFVVGNMSTLEKGKVDSGAMAWRNYAQYLTEQKLVLRLRDDALNKLVSDPIQNTQQLNNQLSALGLYAAPTLGDGNCLFRALSDQYYGSPSQHFKLREQICDWMAAHKQRYAPFVDDERGLDVHLECMRQSGEN
ncbi:P-loop containing nucleoside triphosphate hydrolase protein [Phellopilus nigrolimitatus]|nr:P-loop containing nucleoside triphosphate hydrolase protein [Phellopilus nigrolimitatus]